MAAESVSQWLQKWIIGALFTVILLLAGWVYANQDNTLDEVVLTQSGHATKITKLEIMMEMQLRQNEKLTQLVEKLDEKIDEDRARHNNTRTQE